MNNNPTKLKKLPYQLIFGFLGLFLVSTGVSLAGFTFLVKDSPLTPVNSKTGAKVSRVDLSKPKTESCPINGAMYTKAEKDIWSEKRPSYNYDSLWFSRHRTSNCIRLYKTNGR